MRTHTHTHTHTHTQSTDHFLNLCVHVSELLQSLLLELEQLGQLSLCQKIIEYSHCTYSTVSLLTSVIVLPLYTLSTMSLNAYFPYTVVSRASTHSQVSAQVLVLAA